MPNHIHCLLYVTDKSPKMPALIQNAKRFLAYQIVKFLEEGNKTELLQFFKESAKIKKGAKHKIFEDNYDSLVIQSLKLFLEKLNYIHKNPCAKKWRLAKAPEAYKYSSAANYMIRKGFYDIDLIEF